MEERGGNGIEWLNELGINKHGTLKKDILLDDALRLPRLCYVTHCGDGAHIKKFFFLHWSVFDTCKRVSAASVGSALNEK